MDSLAAFDQRTANWQNHIDSAKIREKKKKKGKKREKPRKKQARSIKEEATDKKRRKKANLFSPIYESFMIIDCFSPQQVRRRTVFKDSKRHDPLILLRTESYRSLYAELVYCRFWKINWKTNLLITHEDNCVYSTSIHLIW